MGGVDGVGGVGGLVFWWFVAGVSAPRGSVFGRYSVRVHVCVCCMWADAPMVGLGVFPDGAPALCGLACWCVGGVCHDGPILGGLVCWWC